jgi:hypothetical protein
MHINLISCGALQSTNVLILIFLNLFFGNRLFGWLVTKNIMKFPSCSLVEITFFTLCYAYIILHNA